MDIQFNLLVSSNLVSNKASIQIFGCLILVSLIGSSLFFPMEQNQKYHLAASEEGKVCILGVKSLPPFCVWLFLCLSKNGPISYYIPLNYIRTEVRGDFNIHRTKFFQDAVFHQKSKRGHPGLHQQGYWWMLKPFFELDM